MNSDLLNHPQFQRPDGWTFDFFDCPSTGHRIRYGYFFPRDCKAYVFILPGLSEFIEKYFEVAHDLIKRNLGVVILDWHAQGKSSRPLPNPHKRHCESFDNDLLDLEYLINLVKKENPSLPLVMLSHSMGGAIGLRFLQQYPGVFKCAAFSAPLLGIKDTKSYPPVLLSILLLLLSPFSKNYIPGGSNWRQNMRKSDGTDILSSDPLRSGIHNAWCLKDISLQVGSPTIGWLRAAIHTISKIKNDKHKVAIPVLFALASNEQVVDNESALAFCKDLPNCYLLEISQSRHEILMEQNTYRNQFFMAFYKLLEENGILR